MKSLVYFSGESEGYFVGNLKYYRNNLLFPLGGGQMLKILAFGFAVDRNGQLYLRAHCEDGEIRLLRLFNDDQLALASWSYENTK